MKHFGVESTPEGISMCGISRDCLVLRLMNGVDLSVIYADGQLEGPFPLSHNENHNQLHRFAVATVPT